MIRRYRLRSDGVPNKWACILVYRHMFERLVHQHGLRDLIWAWNYQDPDWYPGAGLSAPDNSWSGDDYNMLEHKRAVHRHPEVITLDQLPAFLKAPE